MSYKALLPFLMSPCRGSQHGTFLKILSSRGRCFPVTLSPRDQASILNRGIPQSCRKLSDDSSKPEEDGPDSIKVIVYHSLATDVFDNLSFEDWVYNNLDLSGSEVLLLWYNDPCIVIGRHQNPWVECNHKVLTRSEVKLARRKSGGGTVYHDNGNLNCTFFTSRKQYNRKRNLGTIISAIKTTWPDVDVEATCRDDIKLNRDFKISGSASKLGREIAYHHCTLLHGCNKQLLTDLLSVDTDGIKHKATSSVPSLVKNLRDVEASINHQTLIQAIAEEFYKYRTPLDKPKIYEIDPTDQKAWPGIHGCRKELDSWQWIYGKTPPFSVQRGDDSLSVLLHITGGTISGLIVTGISDNIPVINSIQHLSARLKGVRYVKDDIKGVCDDFLKAAELSGDLRDQLVRVCSLIEDAIS